MTPKRKSKALQGEIPRVTMLLADAVEAARKDVEFHSTWKRAGSAACNLRRVPGI